MDLIFSILTDIQPGRLVESLIFLFVLWVKLKPHLKKIEERMEGIENQMSKIGNSVNQGFRDGELRFTKIENRLETLEQSSNH